MDAIKMHGMRTGTMEAPSYVRRGYGRGGALSILLLVGAALTSACSAGVEPDEAEELGTVTGALGEVGCATQACTAANSCTVLAVPAPPWCSQTFAGVVDAPPYGYFSCPSQSRVSISAPVGRVFTPDIEWADEPEGDRCASAKLDLVVHTRPNAQSSWTTTIHRYHGEEGAFGLCYYALNDGYSHPAEITKTSTNEIVLAGSAKFGSSGYRAVKLGVKVGHGPC